LCTKNYIKALKKLIIKLGVDEVVSFDSNFYTHLKLAGLVHDYKNRIFIINHIFLHEKRRKSITFLEYFSILLSLDLKKDEITALFRKKYLSMNNMNKSKQIKKAVLFPYPGTLEVVDEKYWIDVVKVLKSNSIDVFTNIINNKQKVIDGSEGLSLKLNEIVDFVDEKTLIVARRNGLNDLFAFSSCKQLVIYMNSGINEHKRYGMSDIYSRLNRENSLHEVIIRKEYCGESAQEVLTKVLDLLTEERTSNEDIDY
jgi:predicted nucleic acid-binding protein